MTINDLTYQIRGCVFAVYNELGPGLLESIYCKALAYEAASRGLEVFTEVAVPVVYRGQRLDMGYRLDLLVENQVIIEVKSVECIHDVHKKQLLTYLKLMDCRVGLLVNFNTAYLEDKASLFRIVNNLV